MRGADYRGIILTAIFLKVRNMDISKRDLLYNNLFRPSFNVDGMLSGYTRAGTKTVMPQEANCKIDIRVIPNMDPDKVVACIRKHLDTHGYEDIEIIIHQAYPASQTRPDDPAVQALIASMREHAGETLAVWPRYPGAAPHYLFARYLGLPTAFGGLGHGGRTHSINEYITVEGLKKQEYGIASFLLHYGNQAN